MKNKTQKGIQNEIIGISVVALSLIIGISLYTNQGGIIGRGLRSFIVGLFGISSYSLPVLTLIVGMVILRRNMAFVHKYKILVISLLVSISVMAHIASYGKELKSEFSFPIFIY